MAQKCFKQRFGTVFNKNGQRFRIRMSWWLLSLFTVMGACATQPPELYTNYKTSMIRFLGSDENMIKAQEKIIPTIAVPLKVGFAFAPSNDFGRGERRCCSAFLPVPVITNRSPIPPTRTSPLFALSHDRTTAALSFDQ